MIAYRIAGGGYPVFDGTGAERHGGRWNSPGRAVIYGGASFAICMLERLVYTAIGRAPANDRFVIIDIPDDLIETIDPGQLPGWERPGYGVSNAYGDNWYDERRSAVLLAPSAVTLIDRNVVINTRHPDVARITVSTEQPVQWDARLFARPG